MPRLKEPNRAYEKRIPAPALRGDDDGVGQVPERRRRDRTVHERIAGKGRVHAHDMAHELKIRVVIGQVVEGDEQQKAASERLMTILA